MSPEFWNWMVQRLEQGLMGRDHLEDAVNDADAALELYNDFRRHELCDTLAGVQNECRRLKNSLQRLNG